MQITAFTGFSKRINSTKQPTGGTSIECVLKSPTSVIRPTFRITGFNLSWNYIQWGARYYFVEDIVILTNDIAEYSCALDVLATYKTEIGSSTEYVARAASAYNLSVSDEKYPTTNNFDGAYVALNNINNFIDTSNGTYVVGVKSRRADTGIAYYGLDSTQFGSLVDYLFSDVWLDATDVTKALQKMLIDPFDYIVSVNWYPFSVLSTHNESIWFGYWDSGVSAARIDEGYRIKHLSDNLALPAHPQVSRGTYLNGAPYTQMTIDMFSFGRIPIDANFFVDNRAMGVEVNIDIFTGIAIMLITGVEGVVLQSSASFGVPIQLSQVRNDLLSPLINAASAGANAAMGNYIGAAAGIGNAITSAMPQVSDLGSVGSIAAFWNNEAEVQFKFYKIVDEDIATIGRPLCAPRQISSLSGFIQCDNVDLQTVGTPAEKKQIIDFMESGFYYE